MAATRGVYRKGDNVYVFGQSLSDSYTLDLPAATGGGNLTAATQINASLSSGFEPLGVIFSTDMSNADKLSHHVKWTFDDVGTYSNLDSTRLSGRDSNVQYGHNAAHTFMAGTYTVTCYIHDGTDYQTLTKTITVSSAASNFPTTQTIVVGTGSSDWTGEPTGATRVTSMSALLTEVQTQITAGGGEKVRVLFRADEQFDLPGGRWIWSANTFSNNTAADSLSFGRFGAGADPIINVDANSSTSNRGKDDHWDFTNMQHADSRVAFQNIHFKSNYDATTGQGQSCVGIVFSNGSTHGHVTVDSCRFTNTRKSVWSYATQGSDTWNMVFSNNVVDAWEDYGFHWVSGNLGLVGNSIKQDVDAVNGTEGKAPSSATNYADHGPIRMAEGFVVAIAQNDGFSRNSWAANGAGWQPFLRAQTTAPDPDTADYSISENQSEGSSVAIAIAGANAGTTVQRAAAIRIQKNHFVGSTSGTHGVGISSAPCRVDNNIFIQPNVSELVTQFDHFVYMAVHGGATYTTNCLNAEVLIENNSFIDLRSTANQANDSTAHVAADVTSEGWTDFTIRSNIFHAPNRTSPTTVSNLSATDVFTPLCKGSKVVPASSFSNPTPSGVGSTASYEPATGSGAIGNTSAANSAVDDFDGNIRSAVVGGLTRTTYSDGPFEPALES